MISRKQKRRMDRKQERRDSKVKKKEKAAPGIVEQIENIPRWVRVGVAAIVVFFVVMLWFSDGKSVVTAEMGEKWRLQN